MSEEAKSGIAASRALYFSDLSCEESPVVSPAASGRAKRPSYVGISTSLNGYTPYAPYRTPGEAARKISPPLHLPNLLPSHLDSVSLVLNQDGYQKSIEEFHKTMRDLNMGRPENGDMTDNGRIMANDEFYPTSHIKQVIENGEGKSVTTITSFHTPGKQNLVSKQIERLYGNDPMAQVRLTSPEPAGSPTHRRSPVTSSGSPAVSDNGSPVSNGTTPERKYSGGFFSKRFGIKPMKDHSTIKSPETPKEFKPLKVPAVFKLLRPEFREQLKQSSCKVSMPDEGVKERIIPIRMETSPTKSLSTPTKPITTSSNTPTTHRSPASSTVTPSSRPSPNSERAIPITRVSNGHVNGIKPLNGHTPNGAPANGVVSPNGFPRRSVPTVIGFRNAPTSPAPASSEKVAAVPEKTVVIRKLSPLSPKHMVVPSSSPKPAPAPKPEHLMSPPMSPAPSATPSPENPPAPTTPTEETAPRLPEMEKLTIKEADKIEQSREVLVPGRNGEVPESRAGAERNDEVRTGAARNVEVPDRSMTGEEVEEATPEEMELVSEKDLVRDEYQYHDQQQDEEYNEEKEQYNNYYQCGLRERELLCPILEEDNESTASGSVLNLQTGVYSPDDPLLLTEQGEVQDGHYFIKVLENEIFKFEEQICDFEEELAMSNDIPEEHRENILLTVGFAKLLMAQKLAQFRGLCDKNNTVTKEEDPFVPTSHDLAGFWDMVHIQVEQVHNRFATLRKLRSEGWKVKVEEKKANNKAKKNANKLVNKPIKPKEKSEAAKARDEARKKMLEARKKAMRENQNQQSESDLIIIM